MRRFSWKRRILGFSALAALAVAVGCGGDDGPGAPAAVDVGEEHATAAAYEGVFLLMRFPQMTLPWAFGILAPIGLRGDPAVYDEGLQAWTWTHLREEVIPGMTTETAFQDYRLRYIGSGGPQESYEGATSMTVNFTEAWEFQLTTTEDVGVVNRQTNLDFDIDATVTGFPEGPFNVVVNGIVTGSAHTVTPTSTTDADFPTFQLEGNFPVGGECLTSSAAVDFAPYSVEFEFAGQEVTWELLLNGNPLDPPVGSLEYLPCGFEKRLP